MTTENQVLSMSADEALFSGKIQGVVAVINTVDRPLHGLAGLLDWRFRGTISQALLAGAVSGETGECAYLPIMRDGRTFHVLLVGCGGSRKIPSESMRALKKNLAGLRLANLGVSREDFGGVTEDFFEKHLKGVPLCIAN